MSKMDEEPRIPTWIPIRLPTDLIGEQEETIREFARERGYETLRGFHWWIRRERDIWNYYDILREVSP